MSETRSEDNAIIMGGGMLQHVKDVNVRKLDTAVCILTAVRGRSDQLTRLRFIISNILQFLSYIHPSCLSE